MQFFVVPYSFFVFYCSRRHLSRCKHCKTPLQDSCLENPMDGGAWWAAVHGVAKSRTRLSDFTFTFHFHALEKEMATHSSVLAWIIPRTGEPGGLPSMGSHRVGHDWSDLAAAAASTAAKGPRSQVPTSLRVVLRNEWNCMLPTHLPDKIPFPAIVWHFCSLV